MSTGTAINASLLGELDSSKSKPGDVSMRSFTESVVYQRAVLSAKGQPNCGTRCFALARMENKLQQLFVEFDRAVLKNGQEAELNAGIQALLLVGAKPTFLSREVRRNRMDGPVEPAPALGGLNLQVVPSTLRCRHVTVRLPDVPGQRIEGGLESQGLFTPDSKGAFSDPNLRVIYAGFF